MIAVVALAIVMPSINTMTVSRQYNQLQVLRAPAAAPTVKWTYAAPGSPSAIVVADVDGDNKPEILVNSFDLHCLTGAGRAKWVDRLLWSDGWSTPAVADIDGDGAVEIVVAAGRLFVSSHIYCLNGSGGVKWSDQTGESFVLSSPVLADIEGDGRIEAIVGSDYYLISNGTVVLPRVYCFNSSGGVKWSYVVNNTVWYPAIADVNGDGKFEVIAVGGYNVYCLDGTGELLWNYTRGSAIFSRSPAAIGDIDGDKRPEIIVGSEDGAVCCLNGSGVLKWTYNGVGTSLICPTITDIGADGKPEIIVAAGDGKEVYCLDGAGALKWSYSTDSAIWGFPTVADLDLDGRIEILAGSDSGIVYCLNRNGSLKWTYATGSEIYHAPTAADIDGDGKPEVIAPTHSGTIYCLNSFSGAFELPLLSIPFIAAGLLTGLAVIGVVTFKKRR